MKHLRYCLREAENCSIHKYADVVMADLGITYQIARFMAVGDQWWFFNCKNVPDVLPEYLTKMIPDIMRHIGFELTEDEVKKMID